MTWKHQNNQQQIPTWFLDNYPSTKKKKKKDTSLLYQGKGDEKKKVKHTTDNPQIFYQK